MNRIVMYCTRFCPYCRLAERIFEKRGVEVECVRVDDAPERRTEMRRLTGRSSVPQIIIGERPIGGYSDLARLDTSGELDDLITGAVSA